MNSLALRPPVGHTAKVMTDGCFRLPAPAAILACLLGVSLSAAQPPEPSIDQVIGFFDHSPGQPAQEQLTALTPRSGVRLFDYSFASPVSGRVPGLLVTPDQTGRRFAVVLFGHWMMPGSPLRNRNEFLEEAIVLARGGALCLLLDSPLVRPGVAEDPDPLHGQAAHAGVQMAREWRRALDLLLARPDADPKRVAYVGHSFNAGVGAKLTAVEKRIRSFVLLANTYSLRGLVYDDRNPEMRAMREKLGEESLRAYFERFPFDDSAPFVRHSAPASVFLQNGRLDKDPPERPVRESFALFREPKRLEFYEAGHELNAAARLDRVKWLAARLRLSRVDYQALDSIPPLR